MTGVVSVMGRHLGMATIQVDDLRGLPLATGRADGAGRFVLRFWPPLGFDGVVRVTATTDAGTLVALGRVPVAPAGYRVAQNGDLAIDLASTLAYLSLRGALEVVARTPLPASELAAIFNAFDVLVQAAEGVVERRATDTLQEDLLAALAPEGTGALPVASATAFVQDEAGFRAAWLETLGAIERSLASAGAPPADLAAVNRLDFGGLLNEGAVSAGGGGHGGHGSSPVETNTGTVSILTPSDGSFGRPDLPIEGEPR